MGRFGNVIHHGFGPILMDVDDSLDARIIRVFRKIFRDDFGGVLCAIQLSRLFSEIYTMAEPPIQLTRLI